MESDSVDHSRDGNSANKNYLYQNRLKFSFHVIFLLTLERCERTVAAKRFLATKLRQPQSVQSRPVNEWIHWSRAVFGEASLPLIIIISFGCWERFSFQLSSIFRHSSEHLDTFNGLLGEQVMKRNFYGQPKISHSIHFRDPNITFYFIVSRRLTAAAYNKLVKRRNHACSIKNS